MLLSLSKLSLSLSSLLCETIVNNSAQIYFYKFCSIVFQIISLVVNFIKRRLNCGKKFGKISFILMEIEMLKNQLYRFLTFLNLSVIDRGCYVMSDLVRDLIT